MKLTIAICLENRDGNICIDLFLLYIFFDVNGTWTREKLLMLRRQTRSLADGRSRLARDNVLLRLANNKRQKRLIVCVPH